MSDICERTTVDESRIVFECLYKIRLESVLEESSHSTAGTYLTCKNRISAEIICYKDIADTLLAGSMVVLNLEGMDVEVAQRVVDFSSGACYSIGGTLQKVSSYIFILTPANVDVSGDVAQVINGTAVPSIRTNL